MYIEDYFQPAKSCMSLPSSHAVWLRDLGPKLVGRAGGERATGETENNVN